jgi:hypothetical protein
MRGLFLFLIMITIVMLGVAGCPKKDGGDSGVKPATPANNGEAGGESATDGGE